MESKNRRYSKHTKWGCEALYYTSRRLWVRGHRRLALLVKYANIFLFRTYIDASADIGERLDLPHGGFGVVIGPDVTIGDDAILLHNVTVGHAKPGHVSIGHRFLAGTGAIILGPVTIGNDVSIGANTLVNFDVPDGATVVSQRAKVILPKESAVESIAD